LWRASHYLWVLAFFGLTPEYKAIYMTEIHDLVYHGGGGFLWSEVYDMPITTRRFHIRKINEFHEKQKEEWDKANSKKQTLEPNSKNPLLRPDITTRASKK